jgi:type IV fimbrial biogenesis protein FimT
MAERVSGMTLLELMVTLAVVAIIVTIGIPSFQAMIERFRLSGKTDDLVSAIMLTRSEAIKRGVRVTLCKADTRLSDPMCAPEDSVEGYEQGWVVFVDSANPGVRDAGELIIEVSEPDRDLGISITSTAPAFNRYISFTADGFPKLINGGFQAGTMTLCKATKAQKVVMSRFGRIRTEKDATCSD